MVLVILVGCERFVIAELHHPYLAPYADLQR